MIPASYGCIILAVIIIPSLYIWILTNKIKKIHSKSFTRRWGQLFHGVKTDSKGYLVYFFYFVLRRTLYVFTAFFISDLAGIQIIMLNYLNVIGVIIIGLMPLEQRLHNYTQFFNEAIVQIATLLFVCFTDFNPDLDS